MIFGVTIVLNMNEIIVTEIKHYQFNKIRPYLKNNMNKIKKSYTWKIQLTIANNFNSK